MNTQPFDLTGRVALITGGGSGIGRATALIFARFGAEVVLADLRPANADKVAEIKEMPVEEVEAITTLNATRAFGLPGDTRPYP